LKGSPYQEATPRSEYPESGATGAALLEEEGALGELLGGAFVEVAVISGPVETGGEEGFVAVM
jgi:hypothetical protein